jgi:hypothetical protein
MLAISLSGKLRLALQNLKDKGFGCLSGVYLLILGGQSLYRSRDRRLPFLYCNGSFLKGKQIAMNL